MSLRQRRPRQRDETHLAYVRIQPCCVCGSVGAIEAAHIRMANPFYDKRETGMAEKPDDKWTVPLCSYHHQSGLLAQHKVGEEIFWREIHGRDPFEIAVRLFIESGGPEREGYGSVIKRERLRKGRKPPEQRKEIKSNREIRSHGFSSSLRRKFDGTVERRT